MWQTRDLDVTDLDMIVSKDTKNHKHHETHWKQNGFFLHKRYNNL